MRLLLDSKNISAPTEQTILEYSRVRLKKVWRLIKKTNLDIDLAEIKIKTEFNKRDKSFSIKAVLSIGGKMFVVKISDHDLRRAIDNIADSLRLQLVESRGKTWLNAHN